MKIDSLKCIDDSWQVSESQIDNKEDANIVFLFGDSDAVESASNFEAVKAMYPNADIVGTSSSGNIQGIEISDAVIIGTAVQFEKARTEISIVDFTSADDVEQQAGAMIDQLPKENLKHVFVLSEGLLINGSDLVRGLNSKAIGFTISGGMAGDGERFETTLIIANEVARKNRAVAIGFYGDVTISTAYHAGWSPFGDDKIVTKSRKNVLLELNNRPALEIYKEYLGEFAEDLPYSGMRFPLNIKANEESDPVIRTLLAIDEEENSIIFAGDIPEGYIARLMKPDMDVLIDGSEVFTKDISIPNTNTALGLTVSCVGRRVVMKELIEEELESINEVLGDNVYLSGFYSYGEISPFHDDQQTCQLHNQTITLTAVYEN